MPERSHLPPDDHYTFFDATGHSFRSLSVTREMLKRGARMTALTLRINSRAYGALEVRDEPTMNDFLREVSQADRHKVRLVRGAMPEVRGDRR